MQLAFPRILLEVHNRVEETRTPDGPPIDLPGISPTMARRVERRQARTQELFGSLPIHKAEFLRGAQLIFPGDVARLSAQL